MQAGGQPAGNWAQAAGAGLVIACVLSLCGCYPVKLDLDRREPLAKDFQSVVLLERDGLKVGVIPEVGGRIVYLSHEGSDNLLDSPARFWSDRPKQPIYVNTPAPAINGHTTWLSPQSQWWTEQDIFPDRKARRSPWPPDPFLDIGPGKIVAQTPTSLVVELPVSPYTGVQMTKTIELQRWPYIMVSATITNKRSEPVTWGLWSNTRTAPGSRAYVPLPDQKRLRFGLRSTAPSIDQVWPFKLTEGWIHFDDDAKPEKPFPAIAGKLGIDTDQRIVGCFVNDRLLLKRAALVLSSEIHPDHSGTEIFARRTHKTRSENSDFIELEFHGPCVTLQPGQSISFSEFWFVAKPSESVQHGDPGTQVRYLKQLISEIDLAEPAP